LATPKYILPDEKDGSSLYDRPNYWGKTRTGTVRVYYKHSRDALTNLQCYVLISCKLSRNPYGDILVANSIKYVTLWAVILRWQNVYNFY